MNFPQIFQVMTKTVLSQRGGVYNPPSCEVISLACKSAVLTASTDTFSIQSWSDEDFDDTLTF